MAFRVSIFTFSLETTVRENNWMGTTSAAVRVIFFESVLRNYLITAMMKVLSQQLRTTLATTFEKDLTDEDFTDMD